MMRALSSGISGLKAHQTAMDVVGNNIANVDTYGFKSSNTIFRDSLYQEISAASGSGYDSSASTDTGAGGTNPSQIGYGVTASSIDLDTTAGDFSSTGNNKDCKIVGEGYFVIADGSPKTANSDGSVSPSGYKYTRLGKLDFDTQGYLVDSEGNRVCGQTNTATGALSSTTTTLTPASYTTTSGTTTTTSDPVYIHYNVSKNSGINNIAIASDGTITATNNGESVTIGKIALARFQNAAGLEQDGGSYYKSSANSGDAVYAAPGDSTVGTGSLKTGGLESSNVDLATEFANMITYERGFQANSKIMSVADEMLETLVNMKR